MNVTCQFAIYPLRVEALGPPLDAALAAVRRHRLEPEVGPISSTGSAEPGTVMAALKAAAGGDSRACPMPAEEASAP